MGIALGLILLVEGIAIVVLRPWQNDRGDIVAEYVDPDSWAGSVAAQYLRSRRFLESIANHVNTNIALPRNVHLEARECGIENAFWNTKTYTITLCYELFQFFEHLIEEAANRFRFSIDGVEIAYQAMLFVAYHELGHAFMQLYDIKPYGNEEQEADMLAVFMLLAGDRPHYRPVLSAAVWLMAENRSQSLHNMDPHPPDSFRAYNIVCLIYGSSPAEFADLVTSGVLDLSDVSKCPRLYTDLTTEWARRLGPYYKT